MKKVRAIIAALMACITLFSLTSCAGFKVVDDEDVFFDALDKVVSIEKEETRYEKNTRFSGSKVEYLIEAKSGDNTYRYVRFKKEDDAMDFFDDMYQNVDTIIAEKEFKGNHKISESKTRGTISLDGEVEYGLELKDVYVSGDTDFYGTICVNKNVFIQVYSLNGSKRDKEKINNVLKELGLPKP